jgi:glycosyltransferase involved in cell wall biosynthesis
LPVVTTAIGGANEIVTDVCGRLVPPDDAVALSAALLELLQDSDLRATLGRGGPTRAHQLCDPTAQITMLNHLLCALGSAKCSPRYGTSRIPSETLRP